MRGGAWGEGGEKVYLKKKRRGEVCTERKIGFGKGAGGRGSEQKGATAGEG
jgi:hypothetical protein